MSYLLLDDQFPTHRKISGLPVQAKWLHVCALVHCAERLTDGAVSRHALGVIGANAEIRPAKYVPLLVERGLWIPEVDGWSIYAYLEHNPTRAQVEEKREQAKERKRKWRETHREDDGRFTRDGTRDATRDGTPPHPIPIPSQEKTFPPLTLSSNAADERDDLNGYDHALERVIQACSKDPTAREKLNADYWQHRPSEARLVSIHWAITRGDTTDPLAKARSMMKRATA